MGGDLLAGQHGVDRQQPEALDATGTPALDAVGVVDRAAEDLAAAADPEDPGRRREHGPVEAALSHPRQIGRDVLGAREGPRGRHRRGRPAAPRTRHARRGRARAARRGSSRRGSAAPRRATLPGRDRHARSPPPRRAARGAASARHRRRPCRCSSVSRSGPGASSAASPRNRLRTKPARRSRVASGTSDHVPYRWANAPPRSMSATSSAAASACSTHAVVDEVGQVDLGRTAGALEDHQLVVGRATSRTPPPSPATATGRARATASPSAPARTRPLTTTCERVSASGFSSTGFIRTSGSTPAARACSHWATPISPPSTTRALFDMFCALNGTTSTPWRANQRHSAVTSQLLPAPDVQPSTISGRIPRSRSRTRGPVR